MSSPLQVEPTEAKDLGPCECCGNITRRVWGFVHRGDPTEAAYFVQWTPGSVLKHGAHFDLILGRWGDGATRSDRVAISLAFRQTPDGPQFMVIDAADRYVADSDLVGRALRRDEALDSPFAKRAFEIVDAVWLQDPRISELTTDSCARFNERTPDAPGVRYFSISAARPLLEVSPLLFQPYAIVHAAEGPNDGLVSVKSGKWATHLETWPVDHLHVLNRRLLIEWKKKTGDVRPYYAALLERRRALHALAQGRVDGVVERLGAAALARGTEGRGGGHYG